MTRDLTAAVERADLDELLRLIDHLCGELEWDLLSELRERCTGALDRGRQLWPAAAHAEYRLALEAPGPWAGAVLVEGAGRFAPGPLPEVAASTHRWAELAPHVAPGPAAVLAAHERVVRGEDLRATPPAGPPVLDLPLRLARWEPTYCVAHYRSDGADFPGPELPPLDVVELDNPPEQQDRDAGTEALIETVRPWVDGSEGRAEAVKVRGRATDAIAALGHRRARLAPLDPDEAIRLLAWAGASAGAHGRRPGAAAGRFAAWWAAAALTGLLGRWPVDPDTLGTATEALRWHAWDAGGRATGWALHLAVEDRSADRAWAVAAIDPA